MTSYCPLAEDPILRSDLLVKMAGLSQFLSYRVLKGYGEVDRLGTVYGRVIVSAESSGWIDSIEKVVIPASEMGDEMEITSHDIEELLQELLSAIAAHPYVTNAEKKVRIEKCKQEFAQW